MCFRGSANVGATECCADRFAHGDHRRFTSRRRILTDVELDAVRDGEPMPAECHVLVVSGSLVSSGSECGSKGERDPPLQCITRDIPDAGANSGEALSLTLSDLDR